MHRGPQNGAGRIRGSDVVRREIASESIRDAPRSPRCAKGIYEAEDIPSPVNPRSTKATRATARRYNSKEPIRD